MTWVNISVLGVRVEVGDIFVNKAVVFDVVLLYC